MTNVVLVSTALALTITYYKTVQHWLDYTTSCSCESFKGRLAAHACAGSNNWQYNLQLCAHHPPRREDYVAGIENNIRQITWRIGKTVLSSDYGLFGYSQQSSLKLWWRRQCQYREDAIHGPAMHVVIGGEVGGSTASYYCWPGEHSGWHSGSQRFPPISASWAKENCPDVGEGGCRWQCEWSRI